MARVTREVARSGKPFKTVVNDAIRQGLDPHAKPQRTPFEVHARDLGTREGFDFDCVWDLFDRLDGPRARQVNQAVLLIDSNILIYAYDPASRHHERARTWLEGVLSDDEPIRFGLVSLLSFVRILSDPRLFAHPMDVAEAHAHVQTWLDRDIAAIAEPTPAHWSTFLAVATDGQARGPMLMDAHLAALAIEHGATVCTADRDFRRFKGVRVVDPLAERSG